MGTDSTVATIRVRRMCSTLAAASVFAAAACGSDDALAPTPPGGGTDTLPTPPADTTAPGVQRTVYLTGLSNPWDLAFLPTGEMLITERSGRVRLARSASAVTNIAQIADVVVSGEGGLLGMTVDPQFATNRLVYTCFSSNRGGVNDNRVVRWRLADDLGSLGARTDIVTGLPWASGGRHSGCRPRFGPDGMLWIGTGDAAIGENPQRLTSLGGKVLRVTRDGEAAPGNPAIAGADPRIYSYGHRNVQGLAFRPGDGALFAVEHGPAFDDEVTRIAAGGNGGWNPVPGYNEGVSMTDLTRYPAALRPTWKSGSPARGSSGATFLTGTTWRGWNGALAVAQLVGAKLVIMRIAADGALLSESNLFAAQGVRLRVPVLGPDGALYIATDVGGGGGEIWRVSPN